MPRERRAENDWGYRPGQLNGITAPTLFLAGSESPPAVASATQNAADAVAEARIRVLEGHAHMAHKTDPAMVAAIIREFIS